MPSLNWDPLGKSRKPAALCIGAQKAGTSWLAQMLAQNPMIWIPPFKEAHFFNHRFIPGHRYWIDWHYRTKPQDVRNRFERRGVPVTPEMDEYLRRIPTAKHIYTNRWYKDIFAPAPETARPMDFSPEYSALPEEGVEFVASFLPGARIIYLIRHPVDRAISQLRMNLRREKRQPATIDDWMKEIENPVLAERGDYLTYVPRWRRHLGKRLLILPYGRIAADPARLMAEVEAHLRIDPVRYANLDQRVFATPDGLTPPAEAVEALAERLRPQVDFVQQEFGPDFAAMTR